MTMTNFERAITNNLAGIDFVSIGDDAGFGWRACDSCGSRLGGDRFGLLGVIDGEDWAGECCIDCAMYHGNGDLPESGEVST